MIKSAKKFTESELKEIALREYKDDIAAIFLTEQLVGKANFYNINMAIDWDTLEVRDTIIIFKTWDHKRTFKITVEEV